MWLGAEAQHPAFTSVLLSRGKAEVSGMRGGILFPILGQRQCCPSRSLIPPTGAPPEPPWLA